MENKKLKLITLLAFIICLIPIAIYQTIEADREAKERSEEYKMITKNDNYSGVISNISSERGVSYLTLNDSIKFAIDHSRNYDYEICYLNKFIQVGDSIIKHNKSDTLFIIRNTRKYFFVIGEFINEKK